jgi:hypothetical protein
MDFKDLTKFICPLQPLDNVDLETRCFTLKRFDWKLVFIEIVNVIIQCNDFLVANY